MRKSRVAILLLVVVALLVSGCAPRRDYQVGTASEAAWDSVAVERELMKSAAPAPPMEAPSAMAAYGDVAERMIIRHTYMTVVVEDTDAMLMRLQDLVREYGGYISDLNRWLSNDQPYASIVLRIPVEHLEAALGSVREGSIRVESERSSGEVRRNRGSAEDILAIHNRITEIRGQIESLKGRTQFLERMTALATVQIEIRPRTQPGAIVQSARWNPLVTLSNAARSLVRTLQGLVDLAIWLGLYSLLLAVPVIVLWLIIRSARRRRRAAS